MSKLVITFNNLAQVEKNRRLEPGTIAKWVEDGDRPAIAEVLGIDRADTVEIQEDE